MERSFGGNHQNSIGTQHRLHQYQGGAGPGSRGGMLHSAPSSRQDDDYRNWQEEFRRAGLIPTENTFEPNGEFMGSGAINNNDMHMNTNSNGSAFQPALPQRSFMGGGFSFPVNGMVAPSTAFNNGFQSPGAYREASYHRTAPAAMSLNSAYANGGESSSRGRLAHGAPPMINPYQSAFNRVESFAHESAPTDDDFFGQATLEEDDDFDNGGFSSLREYAEFQSTRLAAEQQREEIARNQNPHGVVCPTVE